MIGIAPSIRLFALAALVAFFPTFHAVPLDARTSTCGTPNTLSDETIPVDGSARSYLLQPSSRTRGTRAALVLAFHGRGETPELLARYANLARLDATVVYLRGLPGRGGKLGWSGTPTAAPGVDDVRFARAVVDRLVRAGCVDGSRVFATGKSDGGGLAVELACEAADLVTAVAPVSGAFYGSDACEPTRAVSVLEFHGTADRVVPYDGSVARGLPKIATWLADWAVRDGCRVRERVDAVADDVALRRYSACRQLRTVEGYRIVDGGHTWPGASERSGPGKTTQAIDATAIIGRFFGIVVR